MSISGYDSWKLASPFEGEPDAQEFAPHNEDRESELLAELVQTRLERDAAFAKVDATLETLLQVSEQLVFFVKTVKAAKRG